MLGMNARNESKNRSDVKNVQKKAVCVKHKLAKDAPTLFYRTRQGPGRRLVAIKITFVWWWVWAKNNTKWDGGVGSIALVHHHPAQVVWLDVFSQLDGGVWHAHEYKQILELKRWQQRAVFELDNKADSSTVIYSAVSRQLKTQCTKPETE